MANTTGNASSGSQSVTLSSAQGVAVGQVISGAGIQAGSFVQSLVGNVATISLPTTSTLTNTAVQFSQPMTMTREDTMAYQYFESSYLQESCIPQSWSVASEPPLAFDVDLAPSIPGSFDALVLQSGPVFSPPASSLLGVPDDWSWLPMYGALADVLSREAEATDRARAAYCMNRYTEGLKTMQQSNWLLQATVNGIAVDTPSLAEMDLYAPEWQTSNGNLPAVVQAGMDMVAPTPGNVQGISVTLVGNAPLLDSTGNYVQVSRDDFEAVLNYAHHLSLFKQANEDFQYALPLLQDFFTSAARYNKRLMNSSIYGEVLKTQGRREDKYDGRDD